jgi:phosphoglycolate phosphatase-like HAD superfamily hydrolase
LNTNTTPPSWQAVFFDFDGVIADSTEVKVRAFATLFAPYGPEVQKAVIRYHLDNGGMPRHQKIRHCFEIFAGLTPTDSELNRAGQTFSELVLDAVVAAPFIGGALSTLQRLQQAAIPAFVVSGTPGDEMRLIVERKGLVSYFLEVHGSPRAKLAIVADILARYKYRPRRCLFIGDALADYHAAQGNGLRFLGIVPDGRDSIFPEEVSLSSEVTLPL